MRKNHYNSYNNVNQCVHVVSDGAESRYNDLICTIFCDNIFIRWQIKTIQI